jgi:hypothetical protein
MVPIFAMFFNSYGAQNGARKNYPNLAPISDLFRGTTSLSFRARNGAGNHINLRGVCPRKHLTAEISGEEPDKTLIHGVAYGANSTMKSGVKGDKILSGKCSRISDSFPARLPIEHVDRITFWRTINRQKSVRDILTVRGDYGYHEGKCS